MAVTQETDNCGKAPVTQAVTPHPAAHMSGPNLLDRLREAVWTGSEKEVLLPIRIRRRDDLADAA